MNQYVGSRTAHRGALVLKNGTPLSPDRSLRIENKSPTGFEWGYCGSGPAQLALGILLEEFDEAMALRHYQRFKREIVAGFGDRWAIDSISIQALILRFQSDASDTGMDLGDDF